MPSTMDPDFRMLNAFQLKMWEKLFKHREKKGWKLDNPYDLLERAKQELEELEEAVHKWDLAKSKRPNVQADSDYFADKETMSSFAQNVAHEAADVANYCAMIADVVGGLK